MYHGPDARYNGREICFNSLGDRDQHRGRDRQGAPGRSHARPTRTSAYTHQGWLTEDQRYFFVNDEGDEIDGTRRRTRTIVWDLTDLDDPVVVTEFYGTTAATTTCTSSGRYMYQSNYVAGLRIIDVRTRSTGGGRVTSTPRRSAENARVLRLVEQLSVLQERHDRGDQHARGAVPDSVPAERPWCRDARGSARPGRAWWPRPLRAQARLYVANQDDATVSVIDPATRRLLETVDLRAVRFRRQRQAPPRPGRAGRLILVRHADRGGEGPQVRPRRPAGGQRRMEVPG